MSSAKALLVHTLCLSISIYPCAPAFAIDDNNRFIFSDATGTAPTITFTADNQTRTYGAANPAFTYTASGYIDADTNLTAFTGGPSLSTMINGTTIPGTYTDAITITANTLTTNLGYQFAFDHGDFAITGSAPTPPAPPPSPAPILPLQVIMTEPTISVTQSEPEPKAQDNVNSASDCLVTDGNSGGCIVH